MVFDDTANNPFVVGAGVANTLSGPFALRSAALSSLSGGELIEPLSTELTLWGPAAMNDVLVQLLPHMSPYLMAGADESTEGELLLPGATWSTQTRSEYRDFEFNLGTNQNIRRWRVSVGYRSISLDETHQMRLSGVFDAIDVADGAVSGDPTNRLNDGLSHQALINAGMTLLSEEQLVTYYVRTSSGYEQRTIDASPDGIDASSAMGAPVFLAWQFDGRAYNDLNGAQVTFGYRLVDNQEWSIEAIGKAGLFHNSIHGSVREVVAASGADISVYRRFLTDERSTVAFAGNFGLRGSVALNDYIRLIGGYEILFLSGVALGSEQTKGLTKSAAGTSVYRVREDGSFFAHGGSVGFEVSW